MPSSALPDAATDTFHNALHTTHPVSVDVDIELIRKYNKPGPRYTSYPTADRFSAAFGYPDYLETCATKRIRGVRLPLSLYFHVPFCESLCYYCACNKIVTKNRSKAAVYLDYLKREIAMQGSLFVGINQVEQMHFGGGTPTYFSDEQMDSLLTEVRRWFQFAPDDIGEYSIEVDPRTVSPERIQTLRRQGFNRISFGVQDFDPAVQKAIHRLQPELETLTIMAAARSVGFRSISIDLIYGLPEQTPASMAVTLAKVVAAAPDRIAIYSYAHLPHVFKSQRRIEDHSLPDAEQKLDMLMLCIRSLTEAGYVYIGMDHFAKPDDDLAVAQRQGRLHRNFQGYSTHADADLVSCGVSAISAVGATYSQNEKTLDAYYDALDEGRLPVARGMKLSMDDLLRRSIIGLLICNFELSITSLEMAYPITFTNYFAAEMSKLKSMQDDGLLTMDAEWISVTPKGRMLIRNICMVFDAYLGKQMPGQLVPVRFSKTI